MNFARNARLLLLAAPLALGLAACEKKDGTGPVESAAAIAKIAPPAGTAWKDTVSETPEGGYLIGNPNAPVKVLEYGSLSCPHCAKLAQDGFQPLVNDHIASGRVSLEFRSYAIHPQDVPLTQLAACGGPATFFPLIEEIYKNFDALAESTQKGAEAANATGSLPPAQRNVAVAQALGFTEFFSGKGIAKDQANACLSDVATAEKIAKAAQKYSDDGIESTPTLLINGSKIEGSTWTDLNAALQRAGVR